MSVEVERDFGDVVEGCAMKFALEVGFFFGFDIGRFDVSEMIFLWCLLIVEVVFVIVDDWGW